MTASAPPSSVPTNSGDTGSNGSGDASLDGGAISVPIYDAGCPPGYTCIRDGDSGEADASPGCTVASIDCPSGTTGYTLRGLTLPVPRDHGFREAESSSQDLGDLREAHVAVHMRGTVAAGPSRTVRMGGLGVERVQGGKKISLRPGPLSADGLTRRRCGKTQRPRDLGTFGREF
jgi:hypothetical protein